MKVLQIGKFYPIRGGVEKVMYDIMLGLSERKIYCDMLCAVVERQQPGIIQLNEYARLFCMPTWIKLAATMISPAMIFKLRKMRNDYEVVHIHHPDPMACLALFFSGYKGKVILHWHSDILKQKMLLKLYNPLQKWLLKRADVIVGTTPVYVQQSPFLQSVQSKVTYIPIGVDEIIYAKGEVMKIREKYIGKKIVFSLGRLIKYKGYEYLIKAAQQISDDYVILIGGSGPLKDELQTLICEWGLEEKVKLIGFISENALPHYFEACDLFCLSSIQKTEAFGIVQIEAMSCGKPVVATRIKESGVSWVNADGISGLNVEPQDVEALAKAITTILSDNRLYIRMANNARKRYETFFMKDDMIDRCVELYHSVLENKNYDA
ncbi:glycosyltransferase [uncultured Bacteroides sp.]|uniref:glycosyltransferase n=1 Tax=uncultured Bacteroides sp. TaxID=162156 RepID=UPI002AAABD57|nr:glycosyltransferase [uncultured Bacteroides sp.]